MIDRFQVFLVDQFGVLHDGTAPYPGAIDALRALKDAGKTVIVLSNSGKRSEPNIMRLERLGFWRKCFDTVLSSGEVAWMMLADNKTGIRLPEGARCLFLSRDDDRSAIEGLSLVETTTSVDADVVLLSGSRGDTMSLAAYEAQLAPAAERAVPCLCTNPDKIMLTSKGPSFGAGAIADAYAAMGGPVTWIGKPHHDIYRVARLLAGDPVANEVCCIGDSVEHDIQGGKQAGFATVLVRSGILAELGSDELEALYRDHSATPDFIVDRFHQNEVMS